MAVEQDRKIVLRPSNVELKLGIHRRSRDDGFITSSHVVLRTDRIFSFWDKHTGEVCKIIGLDIPMLFQLNAFAYTEEYVFTMYVRDVYITHLSNGVHFRKYEFNSGIIAMAVHGDIIAVSQNTGPLHVLNWRSGEFWQRQQGLTCTAVALNEDFVFGSGIGQGVFVWDVHTAEVAYTIPMDAVEMQIFGQYIILGVKHCLRIYHIRTGICVAEIGFDGPLERIRVISDTHFAMGNTVYEYLPTEQAIFALCLVLGDGDFALGRRLLAMLTL